MVVCHRTRPGKPQNCPVCSGTRVHNGNCLATLFPEVAKEWHPTKNEERTPNDVHAQSSTKAWFICDKGHEYYASIQNRTCNGQKWKGNGCRYCSGKEACDDNCLAVIFPESIKQWHPTKNGDLTPYDITPSNTTIVWWKCDVADDHVWPGTSHGRTKHGNEFTSCPFCCGKKFCDSNSLASLYPDIAKEWHPTKNGGLKPDKIFARSGETAWWICDKGHEWKVNINNRTGFSKSGCKQCAAGKSERELSDLLDKHFPKWKIKRQRRIWETYRHYHHRRYCDFWLEKDDIKLMIEYDGEQHFKPVRFGGISLERANRNLKWQQFKDRLDSKFCKENGIILHRIKYNEDKEESIEKLKQSLN